jgi:hypothetical protein
MATMTALATTTIGAGGAATIDFTSIPQTYTDLIVKISQRADGTNSYPNMRFNNSATSYSIRYLYGNGSSASSGTGNTTYFELLGAEGPTQTANTFTNQEIYIPNYTSSNFKSISVDTASENNATFAELAFVAGLWSNTSAITSILLRPTGATNFVQYTTATLYGVWKGPETLPSTPTIGTATATGETTATVGFTPTSATNVDANYTALSSPGSITATGSTSPITISGLTGSTAYTFQVRANNPGGSSSYSAASNSITTSAPTSYESIATTTVGSGGSATISFTSIPATYKHLQVRLISRTNASSSSGNVQVTFNSDTTSGNYSFHRLVAEASSIGAYGQSGLDNIVLSASANSGTSVFGAGILDILDYADTNKYKTSRILAGLQRNTTSESFIMVRSQVWTSTSAITSITFTPVSGSFVQYTEFALYGIKGA